MNKKLERLLCWHSYEHVKTNLIRMVKGGPCTLQKVFKCEYCDKPKYKNERIK